MKTIKPILVVAMVLLLGAMAAQAEPTVITDQSGTIALAIENLEVLGTLYNVKFKYGPSESEDIYGSNPAIFIFTTKADAEAANEAINAALNATPGPVIFYIGEERTEYYEVAYEEFDPVGGSFSPKKEE